MNDIYLLWKLIEMDYFSVIFGFYFVMESTQEPAKPKRGRDIASTRRGRSPYHGGERGCVGLSRHTYYLAVAILLRLLLWAFNLHAFNSLFSLSLSPSSPLDVAGDGRIPVKASIVHGRTQTKPTWNQD